MPNMTGGSLTICPFYMSEEQLFIRCEGFSGSTITKINFAGAKRKEKWQREKCFEYGYAKKCPLALALALQHETQWRGAVLWSRLRLFS